MPRVAYNRPISRVGMRIFNQTHPAHAAALSGIRSLGDATTAEQTDRATLSMIGFNPQQVDQIISFHDSGALSDDGYQQLLSGTVAPPMLADFLNADLGAQTTGSLLANVPNWELAAGGAALILLLVLGSRR